MKSTYLFFTTFLAMASFAFTFDPSPLQDFCVAVNDIKTGVVVNGKFCKDPKLVTPDDFFFSVKEENISSSLGSQVTLVTVNEILGLNTLGISLARIDYAPKGLNPPHTHPRATEILIVLEGTLNVGFVTSGPENRLISKDLNKGDVFVFPIGLIHFQHNAGDANAVAIVGHNSENPGIINIVKNVFGSSSKISSEILTKAFQVDNNIVDNLQKQFWLNNN